MALQCTARPWKHACYPGDLPGWWHPFIPGRGVRAGTGSRSASGRGEHNKEQHCQTASQLFAMGELCLMPCAAQGPLQEGCDSWTWAGRSGGVKSRMGEYACRRRRKEEMLAKDMEKDRSWVITKAAGYLHLSRFLTFQLTVQITWYVL